MQILWSAVRIRSYPFCQKSTQSQSGKEGAKGESNPRPLAPEARIIPLDHWPLFLYNTKLATSAGFEPARAEPIGFQVQRLNHSATTAILVCQAKNWLEMQGIEPWTFHMQSERSTTELHPRLKLLPFWFYKSDQK